MEPSPPNNYAAAAAWIMRQSRRKAANMDRKKSERKGRADRSKRVEMKEMKEEFYCLLEDEKMERNEKAYKLHCNAQRLLFADLRSVRKPFELHPVQPPPDMESFTRLISNPISSPGSIRATQNMAQTHTWMLEENSGVEPIRHEVVVCLELCRRQQATVKSPLSSAVALLADDRTPESIQRTIIAMLGCSIIPGLYLAIDYDDEPYDERTITISPDLRYAFASKGWIEEKYLLDDNFFNNHGPVQRLKSRKTRFNQDCIEWFGPSGGNAFFCHFIAKSVRLPKQALVCAEADNFPALLEVTRSKIGFIHRKNGRVDRIEIFDEGVHATHTMIYVLTGRAKWFCSPLA